MQISDWIQDLVQWLRDRLGVAGQPFPAIAYYATADEICKLWLLFDDRAETPLPGLCSLWLCSQVDASADLLLILVNIAQAKEQQSQTVANPRLPKNWHRHFELVAMSAIRQQTKTVAATHLFMVGWISKEAVAQRFVQNRLEYYRHIGCSSVYACDLQGDTRAWAGENEKALKIVRAIAMRCLHARAQASSSTWEDLLRALDGGYSVTWLTWLSEFATVHKQTRISTGHILQPVRSRATLKRPSEDLGF